MRDCVVIGSGPIGLAIAWRAAQRGRSVTVLDAGRPGAWLAAAGMLAPATEAEFGEEAGVVLGLRSLERYPAFVEELAAASGIDPRYRAKGTMVVARDADEAAELERLHAFRSSLDLPVERLLPRRARRREPALAPTVRLALDVGSDHSVDPRALVAALSEAVRRAGGELRTATAAGVAPDGVRLDDGTHLPARQVVVAAGAWAGELGLPVRPVKGQVLRLRDPNGAGLVERSIRTLHGYLVPRDDGGYVLGATVEEQGWNLAATAGGIYELLRDLSEVLPGVLELELEEVVTGARPGTPDNLPLIGEADGVIWAAGHHRNGVLLTPVTADLVAGLLDGEPLPGWAAPCAPSRFAGVPA